MRRAVISRKLKPLDRTKQQNKNNERTPDGKLIAPSLRKSSQPTVTTTTTTKSKAVVPQSNTSTDDCGGVDNSIRIKSNRSMSTPTASVKMPKSALKSNDLLSPTNDNNNDSATTSTLILTKSISFKGVASPSSSKQDVATSPSDDDPLCDVIYSTTTTDGDNSSSIRRSTSGISSAKRRASVFVKRGSMCMEPIKRIDLDEVYAVYKQLGTGRFGYIKLAEHKESKSKIAIKFFPRPKTKQVDFIREYNYSYFVSPHPNIIDTYEGMFQTNDESAFFFVQEFCPCASLREAVEASNAQGGAVRSRFTYFVGIGEKATKEIMLKVLAAIEFMHTENLVHRNLKAENILIFDEKNNKIKVTDFGLTRKVDTTVKYLEYVNNYHAPELCETVVNEVSTVSKSVDLWALGIIIYYCLKGRFPWQKATIMCKPFYEWEQWLKRKNPQLPRRWEPFTEKSLKVFKRTLNPKPKDRWTVKDLRKCVAKERLLKQSKTSTDEHYYAPPVDETPTSGGNRALLDDYDSKQQQQQQPTQQDQPTKRKSMLQQWVTNTLSTMAEISEQVVSARN